MADHIILVEQASDWAAHFPESTIVTAKDYLAQDEYAKKRQIKVINLCRSYRYLSIGYYCSLLAEARKHHIIPSVRTITDLSSKSSYSLSIEDLDDLVHKSVAKTRPPEPKTVETKTNGGKSLSKPEIKSLEGKAGDEKTPEHKGENVKIDTFNLYIFFGECDNKVLQELARQIFDLFRSPLLRVEFRHKGRWFISSIKPASINNLSPDLQAQFIAAYNVYVDKRWQSPRTKSIARYDLAILYNPLEKLPPSNKKSLQKFIKVGKKLDMSIDLIEKKDYSRLAEYDALFIRETTQIDHHTYRFAKKAESEGMAVIDDPGSILKCTNKVYLAELLSVNKIPRPKTMVLQKGAVMHLDAHTYPMVFKIPDGSFSRGMFKCTNAKEAKQACETLFKESDLILAQEFVYTEFDWRIGILNKTPIFACQYYMSKSHWQIVKHGAGGDFEQGNAKTLPISSAPPEVVKVALDAANLIGDGLYGVDVKENDNGVYVIEVNDNPNIDAGIEDAILGDDLYYVILKEFVRRMETRGQKR
jgi:glutathione synthase/RimK-type ligase-like ATP-grasp enzyme